MSGFSKTRRRSFSEQKKEIEKFRKAFFVFLAFFVVYLLLVNFVFSMRVLDSNSMNPGFSRGDRLVFLSFGIYALFPDTSFFKELPINRGNIVLVDFTENRSAVKKIAFSLARFVTAGRASGVKNQERVFVKRVVALPGDEITITNFVARVRPASDPYTYTEYECAEKLYYNNIPENNPQWDESVPFSGNMDTVRLQEGECFLLADDRSNTNDSRTWGPVPMSRIAGKAILRFWPLTKFGIP